MTSGRVRATPAVLAAFGLALTAACGGAQDGADERRLTVLAAASLTESFGDLAGRFEADHPGVDVVTSFDSSAAIAAQVVAGAPADVVATADTATMRTMRDEGVLAGPPVVFAHNELALVVPPDNPAGIEDLGDLQQADYVVCAQAAPCGALAADLLADEGVTKRPRSLEVDVKAVLTKVLLDEADAGLVYASDVVAAKGKVTRVPLPNDAGTATSYPIAVTVDSERPELARSWIDLVRSEEGRKVLTAAGFTTDGTTGAAP